MKNETASEVETAREIAANQAKTLFELRATAAIITVAMREAVRGSLGEDIAGKPLMVKLLDVATQAAEKTIRRGSHGRRQLTPEALAAAVLAATAHLVD